MATHFFIVILYLLYPRLIAASGRQGGGRRFPGVVPAVSMVLSWTLGLSQFYSMGRARRRVEFHVASSRGGRPLFGSRRPHSRYQSWKLEADNATKNVNTQKSVHVF